MVDQTSSQVFVFEPNLDNDFLGHLAGCYLDPPRSRGVVSPLGVKKPSENMAIECPQNEALECLRSNVNLYNYIYIYIINQY